MCGDIDVRIFNLCKNLTVSVTNYYDGLKRVEFKSESTSATFKTDKGFEVVSKRFKREWDKLPERVA